MYESGFAPRWYVLRAGQGRGLPRRQAAGPRAGPDRHPARHRPRPGPRRDPSPQRQLSTRLDKARLGCSKRVPVPASLTDAPSWSCLGIGRTQPGSLRAIPARAVVDPAVERVTVIFPGRARASTPLRRTGAQRTGSRSAPGRPASRPSRPLREAMPRISQGRTCPTLADPGRGVIGAGRPCVRTRARPWWVAPRGLTRV
jgi:hypothetical protein